MIEWKMRLEGLRLASRFLFHVVGRDLARSDQRGCQDFVTENAHEFPRIRIKAPVLPW